MCTSAVPDLLTFLCSVFIHMFLLCCSKTYFYALCFCIVTHKWPWKSMGESLYWHHHKDKCFLHSGWEILSKQLPACVLKQRKKRDDGIWAVAATLIHGSFPTGRRVARCLCVFFLFVSLYIHISAPSLISYALLQINPWVSVSQQQSSTTPFISSCQTKNN